MDKREFTGHNSSKKPKPSGWRRYASSAGKLWTFIVGGGGLVALVGVYFAAAAAGHWFPFEPHPSPTPTTSVPVGTPVGQPSSIGSTLPTQTGGPTASPATTGPPVYWSGPVEFATYGYDFDSKPPATDQTTIIWEGNELQATANALLAVWTQPGRPSASQCQTWVTTHANQGVPFPAIGMQICIKTDQGRYGLLHIDSYSNNNYQLNATATIWGS